MAGHDDNKVNEDDIIYENDVDISDQEENSDENMSEGWCLISVPLFRYINHAKNE